MRAWTVAVPVLVFACGGATTPASTNREKPDAAATDNAAPASSEPPPTAATAPVVPAFVVSNFPAAALDMTKATDVDISVLGDGGCSINTDDLETPITAQHSVQTEPDLPAVIAVLSTVVHQANGAPDLLVIGVKSFKMGRENGYGCTVTGSRGLVIYSEGPVTIAGDVRVSNAMAGLGTGPTPSTAGAGSPGGSFCGVGGLGAGSADAKAAAAYGSPSLVPLFGGSAGGPGTTNSFGEGGGAIQITSLVSIDITGTIEVDGSMGDDSPGTDEVNGSGGGGSGGAILLEAPSVTGNGTLSAAGGVGGSAEPVVDASGGEGSGPTAINGGAGHSVTSYDTLDNGGGGGGAGYIRINTASGAAAFTGKTNPALTTTCATQGRLHH